MFNPFTSFQLNDDDEERRARRSVASTSSTEDSLNVKMYVQMFQDNVSKQLFSISSRIM